MLADLIIPDALLGAGTEARKLKDPAKENAVLYYWPAYLGLLVAWLGGDAVNLIWQCWRSIGFHWTQVGAEVAFYGVFLYCTVNLMSAYARDYGFTAADFGLETHEPWREAMAGVCLGVVIHLPMSPSKLEFLVNPNGALVSRALASAWGFFLPAAVEELVCRGFVYALLCRRMSERKTIFVTAVLFSLWHQNPLTYVLHWSRLGWVEIVARTISGLLFGWLRARTGGLVAPTAAHVACNVLVDLA